MLGGMRKMLGERTRAIGAHLSPIFGAARARLREALTPAFAAARGRYQKLEARERLLVQIAGVMLGLFVAFDFVVLPIQGAIGGLGERIQARQHDAVDVAHLMRTYQRLHVDLATMRSRTVAESGDFSLFSVVEQALTRAPGKDKIGSITPTDKTLPGGMKQYAVELKLNGLSLPQVVDTLYGLGAMNVPVTIATLHVARRSQDPHTFDVEMTCVALGRSG